MDNTKELHAIKRSKYFNKYYYYILHPSVLFSGLSAAKHYLLIGWKKNYNPSTRFNTCSYLDINTDVRAAGLNPLVHYELYGKHEKRDRFQKFKLLKIALNCKLFKRNAILMADAIHDKHTAPIDNFALFEYIMSLHQKDIKVYYILNKEYKYYSDIKRKYGKHIIPFDTHKTPMFLSRLFFLCFRLRYVLDSFDIFYVLFGNIFVRSKYTDIIFTQHGITFFKKYYIRPDVYGQLHLNKTVVSNNVEYNIFKELGLYKPVNIIKSGLFRWDLLNEKSKTAKNKTIFVYFTYRHYLKQHPDILNTKYFKNIFSILNDKRLLSVMKRKHITFNLALHHALLRYIDKSQFKDFNINLVTEEDIGKIKRTACLLLTDYSSMCFEFLFQNKPVVFYRLDEEDFYNSERDCEYSRDMKLSDKLIFNVFKNQDKVVDKIIEYINNDFTMEPYYKKKASKFFYNKQNIRNNFYNYLKKNW